ncbi:MAG: RNA polymerase sigma factor [bacterium]|nr:RNA polymerase sigma factor [bacterium]
MMAAALEACLLGACAWAPSKALGSWLNVGRAGMTDVSDEALVARTQAGEVEAFSELVTRHQRVVYNLAYRFMREAQLAEDMAQEAFLKAYRHIHGFRGDCSFTTWLYRVTSNVCLTELKRRGKRAEVPLSPAHEREAEAPDKGPSDAREVIRRCVTKLPDKYAQVITLYYLQGISYEEIVEIMDIPEGTVKTWMHRARSKLKSIITKELGEHGLELLT